MQGIKKASKVRFRDAVIDPPQGAYDKEERAKANTSAVSGTLLGSATGAGLMNYLSRNSDNRADATLGGLIGGGMTGATIGDLVGNYRVLKKREREGEPLRRSQRPMALPDPSAQLPRLGD